ncbi:MAG: hypothetical protein HS119_11450 [Flavobacteriales bacterium]|nr:hypothetical protein [Flavobacteriales bacterium]
MEQEKIQVVLSQVKEDDFSDKFVRIRVDVGLSLHVGDIINMVDKGDGIVEHEDEDTEEIWESEDYKYWSKNAFIVLKREWVGACLYIDVKADTRAEEFKKEWSILMKKKYPFLEKYTKNK